MSEWFHRYRFMLVMVFVVLLGGGTLFIGLKLIDAHSVDSPRHGFRITPREASEILSEYFEKGGINLHLPYLFVVSGDGYLFGYPPNSKSGPPYTIQESACYEVNGKSGTVRKLNRSGYISTTHYQFLPHNQGTRRLHANIPQPAYGGDSPSVTGKSPNNNRSAPCQPPEGPPPAEPGSAPR